MNHPGMPPDPLDLNSVDRDIHEQFLRNVLDYESAPISCQFARLVRDGVELPPLGCLDDVALHAKLWEVVHALAKHSVYLERTDHLSDRELYEHLWSDSLREEGPMMPAGSGWTNHIDILGGCSEEDIKLTFADSPPAKPDPNLPSLNSLYE